VTWTRTGRTMAGSPVVASSMVAASLRMDRG